jgi:hypothetical protein
VVLVSRVSVLQLNKEYTICLWVAQIQSELDCAVRAHGVYRASTGWAGGSGVAGRGCGRGGGRSAHFVFHLAGRGPHLDRSDGGEGGGSPKPMLTPSLFDT